MMLLAQVAESAGGGVDLGALLAQLGTAGILIFLFLKEMFSYLKSRDSKKGSSTPLPLSDMFALLRNIDSTLRELHRWHDAKDEDQVFVWYVRKSLEKQIERLADAVAKMTAAAEKQTEMVEDALSAILEELQSLRSNRSGGSTGG